MNALGIRISAILLTFTAPAALLGQRATFTARLDAADGASFENFGDAVAVSGATAVVGAPGDDEWGRRDGAAYVFERDPDDGSWAQVAKLAPPDEKGFPFGGQIDQGDNFGRAVAISGDVIVVGAPGEDVGASADAGAAYVFERDAGGDGNWGPVARLAAGVTAADRRFGLAAAISGDTVVVGAPGDPSALLFTGSAYVFERDADGAWTAVAELAPAGGDIGDFAGFSVAVAGSTALLGAPFADPAGDHSGAAFVFERGAGGAWSQTARLLGDDSGAGDRFGTAVTIAEGSRGTATAVVGAPRHDVPDGPLPGLDAGAAYVFERIPVVPPPAGGPATTWQQASRLVASDSFKFDRFGEALAFVGGAAIVGAPGNNVHGVTGGYGSGSVYLFRRVGAVWTERDQVYDFDAGLFDLVGSAVAISGLTFVAGTPLNNDHGPSSGSVMVFEIGTGTGTDLAVFFDESADPVAAGSPLTYEVRLENRGPEDVAGVSLRGQLSAPPGVRLAGARTSAGALRGATWTIDRLAAGESAILTVDLVVEAGASAAADAVRASMALVGEHEFDRDSDNNSASVATSIASE